MATESPTSQQKLSSIPITKSGRESFVALVLIAVIVGVLTASVPAAVAVLAVGGLVLGAVLLALARRAPSSQLPRR